MQSNGSDSRVAGWRERRRHSTSTGGLTRRAVLALAGAALAVPLATAPADAAIDGIIPAGTILSSGELVTSQNGGVFLAMQGDGNLVLYRNAGGRVTPVWASGTGVRGSIAAFQTDGNLVIYGPDRATPVWDTHTGGSAYGANRLKVQDDQKLVMYRPDGGVVWQTLGPNVNIEFHRRLDLTLRELRASGYRPTVVSGYRTFAEQDALYQIGRRGKAGEKVVTNARGGQSWHNYGVAADVSASGAGFASTYGRIAEANGLTWGGRFVSLVDTPHVELHPITPGFTTLSSVSQRGTNLRAAWDAIGLP